MRNFLKERFWRSFNPEDDPMVYWRERILFTMLACGLVLSPLVLPPVMALIVKERLWHLGAINASAFVGMVYLLFSRKASYRLRAGGTLLIVYGVSLGILWNVGIASGAFAWLFAFSVLAGVLLGLRAAYVAIAMNLATLGAFWYGTSHGIFGQQFQFFSTPERAFAALFSFAMVNIAAAVSVAVMLRGLERETRRQKEVTDRLKREMEERQRSETALKKSESMLKSTFRATPVGLAVVKDRRFIAVNESFSRITGYGEDELLGRTSRMLYENDDEYARAAAELYASQRYKAFAHIETREIRKDGTVCDILLRAAHFSPLDPLAGSVVAIEDVTEKRRAERALRESEEKFRTTFKGSPDAITITRRRDGRFIEVNEGFTKMSGYEREDVIGKSPSEMNLIVSSRDREVFERKLEQEGSVDAFEMQYRTKSGVIRDTLLAARPLIYENEACLVAVVKDISQMKRTAKEKAKLEKQLHQAQKMESMGTLAGGIAHDFNNLLMGIQGRVSLMLMDKDPSYPDFENLKGIEEYIQNAVALTRQLLGFARGGKYEVKPTDMNELIGKSAGMFGRTRKEIRIRSKYHADIWTVNADRGQISQVLMNLYVNAWQAMPRGGTLFLETDNVTLDEKYVKPFSLVPGNYVKISVTDTGIGMDKSTQKRIFDPFFTTKEMSRGTGLGLASAYGIVKNHGGIINVYSEEGEGTTFTIYLPVSDSEVVDLKPGLSTGIRRGSETLLLVDDEPMILETAEELLNALGYEVFSAKGGKEAVHVYEKRKERIDAVILDMIMPDMSGGDTFDRLKAINPGVKVILSSGYAINGHAEDIMNRGCDAFIQKPYNIKELSDKLAEVLT